MIDTAVAGTFTSRIEVLDVIWELGDGDGFVFVLSVATMWSWLGVVKVGVRHGVDVPRW